MVHLDLEEQLAVVVGDYSYSYVVDLLLEVEVHDLAEALLQQDQVVVSSKTLNICKKIVNIQKKLSYRE